MYNYKTCKEEITWKTYAKKENTKMIINEIHCGVHVWVI
jgi:hypothetical protein